MNKIKFLLFFLAISIGISGCSDQAILDSNTNVADNSWTYSSPLKEKVEIKDAALGYNIQFKLRHTADYRYSNLFVLFRLKGEGLKKTIRFEFKLAKLDGQWLGKGSGNLYTRDFPVLSNFHFPKAGKYEVEIEQNMRDNPLKGVSDIGLTILPSTAN